MRFDIQAREAPRPYSIEQYDAFCADGSLLLASSMRNAAHEALQTYGEITRDDPALDWPKTCVAFAGDALRVLQSPEVDPDAVRRLCLQFEMDSIRIKGIFDLHRLHDYLLAHIESGRRGLAPDAELEQVVDARVGRQSSLDGLPGADAPVRVEDEPARELMAEGTLGEMHEFVASELTALLDAEPALADLRERLEQLTALAETARSAASEAGLEEIARPFEEQVTLAGVIRRCKG